MRMEIKMSKYPSYKDSGVEWLGEIPSGWEILPGLSFIFENKERNKGMIRNTILSLSYGNIRVKGEDELTGLVPESFETYQFVNNGDLIFRPTDLQNDTVSLRSSISEYEGIITNAYLNLRFKPNSERVLPSFLYTYDVISKIAMITITLAICAGTLNRPAKPRPASGHDCRKRPFDGAFCVFERLCVGFMLIWFVVDLLI